MDVDARLRRAALELQSSLAEEPVPNAAYRLQRRWPAAVLSAAVALALVGGVAALTRSGNAPTGAATTITSTAPATTVTPSNPSTLLPDDSSTYTNTHHGFEVTYPAGWYRAQEPLAPALTSPPQEVLSLATFPLRIGQRSKCPEVPLTALLDMTADDVLISVMLGAGDGDPWPSTFGPDSFPDREAALDAETCSGRSDLTYRYGVFVLDDRQVQVFTAFGDSVAAEVETEAWHILDSFTLAPAPPSAEPATGPLFGDDSDVVLLFDDGIDGVLAIDPDTRIGSRRVIPGQVAGDQPYRLTRVGDKLVVGWSTVYADDIISGESTRLGNATIYVPAAEPDRVWLVKWSGDRIGQGTATAWQVDMSGQAITEPSELGADGYPQLGIPGGLAVRTEDGIRLWYPETGLSDVGFGDSLAVVVGASGDHLAYCPSTDCTEMRIINLTTQETVIVSDETGFSGRLFGGPSARFSPDGSRLAIASAGGLVIANTDTGRARRVDGWPVDRSTYVAWSADGRRLYVATYSYGTTNTTIGRYDTATGDLVTAWLPFGGALDFIVLEPAEAAGYLQNDDQPPSACPPVADMPSGRTGICGFRF